MVAGPGVEADRLECPNRLVLEPVPPEPVGPAVMDRQLAALVEKAQVQRRRLLGVELSSAAQIALSEVWAPTIETNHKWFRSGSAANASQVAEKPPAVIV